jgi:hypothetical protein
LLTSLTLQVFITSVRISPPEFVVHLYQRAAGSARLDREMTVANANDIASSFRNVGSQPIFASM